MPSPRDAHGPHAGGGPLPDRQQTTWALAAHLSAFLGAWVTVAFVGPLVVWLIKRDDDPFVERHAREALNFNLTLFLLLAIGVILSVVTLGLGAIIVVPIGLLIAVVWAVLTIVASLRASEGKDYRYPLSIRFVR